MHTTDAQTWPGRIPSSRLNASIRVLWDITYRCNLSCLHCFVSEGARRTYPHELNAADTERLIANLSSPHIVIREFNFQGGEPILAPNFLYAVRVLAEMGIPWSVNTNGTLWDEQHFSVVSTYPPAGITVSLDGPDRATHDWLRGEGVLARLERTVTTLTSISTRGQPVQVDAICVLNKRNVRACVDILTKAASLGIGEIVLARLSATGRAARNREALEPESSELIEVLQFVCANRGQYGNMRIYVPWATPRMIAHFNRSLGLEIPLLGAGCQAIRGEVTISPNGELRPCPNALDRLRQRFGVAAFPQSPPATSLLERHLTDIRTGPYFARMYETLHGRAQAPRRQLCLECEFHDICTTCPSERLIGVDEIATLCQDFARWMNSS